MGPDTAPLPEDLQPDHRRGRISRDRKAQFCSALAANLWVAMQPTTTPIAITIAQGMYGGHRPYPPGVTFAA